MRRVRVTVPRLRRYSSDVTFEVFGDLGEAGIDFVYPLTPRPVALWPEAGARGGHLLDGHLTLRHLDGVDRDGHLEGAHLEAEHLYPAMGVYYDTPEYVFGRYGHAVKMYDGAGNASAETVSAITVNEAPSAPAEMARAAYDAGSDRISFAFAPGRFEAVAGK
jgi:hypothetical protein